MILSNEIKTALKISIPYLFISVVYILLSDKLVESFKLDYFHITMIQTYKGWGFVFLTTVFLFILLFRELKKSKIQSEKFQQALIESRENYRFLVEKQKDLIIKMDQEGNLLFASNSYCKLIGKSDSEIQGTKFLTTSPSDSNYSLQEILQKLALPPHYYVYQKQTDTSSGLQWIEWSLNAVLDESKRVNYIIGVGRDITDRKIIENNLKESEQRYRSLFENMNTGFVLFETVFDQRNNTSDLIILAANEGFEKTTGLKLESVIGKRLTKVLPGIEKDKADWIGVYSKVAATGEPVRFEQKSQLLGIYYSVSAFKSGPNQCAVTFDDVTQLKLAAHKIERFSRIFEESINEIYLFDPMTFKFKQMSKSAQRNLGYSVGELNAMTPVDIKPEFTVEKFSELVNPLITGEKDSIIFETIHQRKDGTTYPVEVHLQLVEYENEKTFVAFILDITDRRIAESKLKKEKDLLNAIVNNIPVMITRYDPSINLLLLNKETERLLGWSTEEAGKMNLMEKVYPDPVYRKQVADYMAKATVEWREFQCTSKSGEIIDSQWSNIRLDDGTQIGIGIDIRDRKKYEAGLIESEKKYRLLFENNPHPMWVYDAQTLQFLAVNQAAVIKYGYTREEFLSMTIKHIRPEEDVDKLVKHINGHREIVQDSGIWRHKLKNGAVIDVEILSHGLIYENKPARLVLANDVTRRIAAEKQIQLKSENLSKLLEISLELNQSYSKKDVLQKIVDNSISLIGVDSGAIYLVNDDELRMAATYPRLPSDFPEEYRKASLKNHPHIHKAVRLKSIVTIIDTKKEKLSEQENIIVHSSNFRSLIYLPLIASDAVIGVLIIGTVNRVHEFTESEINLCLTLSNLSALALSNSILFNKLNQNVIELNKVIDEKTKTTLALAESEERFHSMFEKHHAVMLLIEVDSGRIIDANNSAVNYYGYTLEEIKSMKIDQINILGPEKVAEERKKAASESRTYFNFPHRLKSGEIRNVEVYTTPIKLKGDTVLFSIIHDITERKKAEDEVLRSREMLRALTARLERIKEEERINLSRDLHDNLGQSLTALKMDTAWIERKIRELKISSVEAFIEKANSMAMLIDDIINNVRRISSELRPNTLDYLGLIPSLEWLVKDFQNRTEIKSTFKCEVSEIPISKDVASSAFRILQEAFTNIIRHAKATEVKLKIDETDDNFRIQLSDNGKGIEPARLLDTKSLGIIGMNERALQFGGQIIFSAHKPNGTTVTLLIPKGTKV